MTESKIHKLGLSVLSAQVRRVEAGTPKQRQHSQKEMLNYVDS